MLYVKVDRGFPGDSVVKNLKTGKTGLIPGSRRSSGEVNGNTLQYSCLGNPIDRGGYSPWGPKRVGLDLGTK